MTDSSVPFIPVILSGGAGVRLWPLSRPETPKQFLPLGQKGTLFHETLARLPSFFTSPLIVGNQTHKDLVAQEIKSFSWNQPIFIGEPCGRNTTAAITLAALCGSPHRVLAIFPSDHWITSPAPLEEALQKAYQVARKGHLVTLGIKPRSPETGYGYIHQGPPCEERGVYHLKKFIEKPPLSQALSMIQEGEYLWNSGIFVFHAETFLKEVGRLHPLILQSCQEALSQGIQEPSSLFENPLMTFTLKEEEFSLCPSIAVDYGIMEKTSEAFVVPVEEMGWSDVGSWQGLWQVSPQDDQGNVIKGEATTQETYNCYIHGTHRQIATLGIQGLTIIETPDIIYVGSQEKSQEIRSLVEKTKIKKQ